MRKNTLLLCAAAAVVSLPLWNFAADEPPVVRIPAEVDQPLDAGSKAALMQGKLSASGEVLEGLVNGDFEKIKHSADALKAIATVAPRQYTDISKLYAGEHLRKEFLRLSEQLGTMAENRNLEGAAYVHQNITATCIACHTQLRERNLPPEAR